MATRYDEIIKLRAGKAAYNIAEEKEGEWESFIPNKQFDYVPQIRNRPHKMTQRSKR